MFWQILLRLTFDDFCCQVGAERAGLEHVDPGVKLPRAVVAGAKSKAALSQERSSARLRK